MNIIEAKRILRENNYIVEVDESLNEDLENALLRGSVSGIVTGMALLAAKALYDYLYVYHNAKVEETVRKIADKLGQMKPVQCVVKALKKYPNIPVISADDDCLYTCNYAEQLYSVFIKKKGMHCIVRYTPRIGYYSQGPCTLYYIKPEDADMLINELNESIIAKSRDDEYYSCKLSKKYKLFDTNIKRLPFIFHDMVCPLTKGQQKNPYYRSCFRK